MDAKIVALILGCVWVVTGIDQQLCPKQCKCSMNLDGHGIARCSILDHELQRFSPSIHHLIIENGKLPMSPEGDYILDDGIFADLALQNVRTIKIVNSSLKEIHPKAFDGLDELQELDLSYNQLSEIDPGIIRTNIEVQKLKLKGNPIKIPENGSLLISSSVEELDLSECGIDHLTDSMFSQLEFVEILILQGNKITEVKPGILKDQIQLTDLYLDDNLITKLDPNAFEGLIQLYTLKLSGNPLNSLEGIDLVQVTQVDISRCNIVALTENTLEGLTQLSFLNLSHNQIESIHRDAFHSLPDLAYLYLSHNKIKEVPKYLFEHNKKLEVISFAGNSELHKLGGFSSSFENLYLYDISDCGLGEISEDSFSGMHYLATLNVSGNSLQEIDPSTFLGLKFLKKLDLSRNKLITLPPKVFSQNKDLERLYLGSNLFHHVPAYAFVPTEYLTLLDMSDNRLTTLWNSTRLNKEGKHPLGRLVYLNLANNRLKRFKESDFKDFKRLGRLNILGNPLECNVDFGNFIQWLILQEVTLDKGPAIFPVEMTYKQSSGDRSRSYYAQSWDELMKQVCPVSKEPELFDDGESDNEEDSDEDDDKETTDITLKDTISVPKKFEKLQIIGIEDRISLWPILLVGVVTMCVLFAVFNVVGLCVARRRYNLVTYKSQFPSPLGGMSQVRRGDSTHIYHKLYEDCSVPNTPIVKNGRGKCLISYLSGTATKNPIQDV